MSNLYKPISRRPVKVCTCYLNGEFMMCREKTKDSPCMVKFREDMKRVRTE